MRQLKSWGWIQQLLFSHWVCLCLTLCDPMDCSMPGFPVLHYLPVCSNSCPWSWWCHPTISSSIALFSSSCLQSFPASGSFPMSWLFSASDQSIGDWASVLTFRVNFLEDWLVWSPCHPRDSQESSLGPQFESISSLPCSTFFTIQLSHLSMTTGKAIVLTIWTSVGKLMSLLFNTPRFVIASLPRSKRCDSFTFNLVKRQNQ